MGGIGQAKHPWIRTGEGGKRLVLLRIIQGEGLLPVGEGRTLAHRDGQGTSQHKVGCQEIRRLLVLLGEGEKLFSQLSRCLRLAPHNMKMP